MSRYEKIKFKKDSGRGVRHQEVNVTPRIPHEEQDIFVQTSQFDRLDILAHKYYNNRQLWWIIASANNIGKGTLAVPEGIIIRIPMNISGIQNLTHDDAEY
tara:strand:- start:16774 stop:17076 length:303 start_codon:yes stop_codon:yes gene_type:complete